MSKQSSSPINKDAKPQIKTPSQPSQELETTPDLNSEVGVSLITRLQRTIGNRAVQRFLGIHHSAPPNLISRHPDDVPLNAAKEEAKKFDAIRLVADNVKATLEELQAGNRQADAVIAFLNLKLNEAKQENWKKPIRTLIGTGTSLKLRFTTAIETRQNDAKFLKEVLAKEKAITKKYSNIVAGAGSGFNAYVKATRDALEDIASASTADAINLALATSNEKRGKSTEGLAKFPAIIVETQKDHDDAHDGYRQITNLTDASNSAGTAVANMANIVKAVHEAKALATMLDGFVARGAAHAATLAQAKLNAITKAAEAKAARDKANELQKQLEDAKKAAEAFQIALDKVTLDTSGLLGLKTEAEKLVAAAEENLALQRKSMAALATQMKVGDAEPYMVEGYMKDAQESVDNAIATLAQARLTLQQASDNAAQGLITQEAAQKDADVSLGKATDPIAIKAAEDASNTASQAEGASVLAGEAATETQKNEQAANVKDTEEQNFIRDLRGLVGGKQVALDELLTFVPDKQEAKTLIDELTYPFLISCLKDTDIKIDKLRPFYAAYKASYFTDCNKEHLKSIMRKFTFVEFQNLHAGVAYDKIKEWIASSERENFRGYVDDFTLPQFTVWQAQLTVPQMIEMIQKITMVKLKTIAASYTALEFKPYVADFTMDILAELLTGFTASELKAYVTTLTYVKLKEMVNTHGLKSDALKKYEAAWLKTFVGVGAGTMAHLTAISINPMSAQISGGHDTAIFTAFINGNYPGTAQRRGAITQNDNAAPISHVHYTLYFQNGNVMTTTGYKSLIPGLAGAVPAWQAIMNTALWTTLKNLKFEKAGGVRIEGGGYGFYYNGGTQVDTAFPL